MTKAELHSITEAGEAIYQSLRADLERSSKGKYIVIDVDTREFEIDRNHLAASDRASAKRPDARLYVTRIGYDALCRIGRSFSGTR